jgi:hypothetical protein
VVDDHGDRPDLVAEGGFEHPAAQRLDKASVRAFEEAALGRVPFDLFAGRDAHLGGDAGQVCGEGGQTLLGEDRRREREQVPEPGARRAGLLAVVQERHPHQVPVLPQ